MSKAKQPKSITVQAAVVEQARVALQEALAAIQGVAEPAVELFTPLRVTVEPEEYDPHEMGPIVVRIDRDGITQSFLGDHRESWTLSWCDLRAIARTQQIVKELQDEADDLRVEIEVLREEKREAEAVIPLKVER